MVNELIGQVLSIFVLCFKFNIIIAILYLTKYMNSWSFCSVGKGPTAFTTSHVCACSKPEPGFPTSGIVVCVCVCVVS